MRRMNSTGLAGWALVALVALSACGGGDEAQQALMAEVDAGNWEEVRAQATLLREAGVVAPWLDYAEGLSSLHLGAEQNARRLLAAAVTADSTLAMDIAASWAALAHEDYEAGWRDRARERMSEAILTYPPTDPGPMLPAVADYLYRHIKEYDAARPLYRRLYEERPEPSGRHAEWMYRWGHLLELGGDLEGARRVYEEFIETFPEDRPQGRYARWRYMKLLLLEAEASRARGSTWPWSSAAWCVRVTGTRTSRSGPST